jgi:predicted RNase H-like nuclease (RuvC/YqgF family)
MTQATDTDIRDLTNLITNLDKKLDKLDSKIDNLEIKIDTKIDKLETKLENKIDNLETKFDGKFDTVNARLTNIETNTRNLLDLAEKIGELKNWKQIAIVVFTASVSGAIAWYVRGGSGNP